MKTLFRLIVGFILKLAIFLAVWMLMGNWLFDTGECNFFGIDNPNISLLLFGIVNFVGSEAISYGASKLKKVIQTKKERVKAPNSVNALKNSNGDYSV